MNTPTQIRGIDQYNLLFFEKALTEQLSAPKIISPIDRATSDHIKNPDDVVAFNGKKKWNSAPNKEDAVRPKNISKASFSALYFNN